MSQELDEDEMRPLEGMSCSQLAKFNLQDDIKHIHKGGSLKSIKLVNFMCHESFELHLGPRVNFIIGPNGSGKSALLTAIVVALGGRATITNRARRADEFVMFGKRTAKVSITIHNYDKIMDKCSAFKPDEYGKSIIVERTISTDEPGSKLAMRDDRGKKVSERKQELDDMLEHFGILINNPICILNQEISKTFLHSKKPEDKFELFMKATTLEQIEEDYEFAQKTHKEWELCNEGKTFTFKMLDGEYKSCKEKLTYLQNRAQLEEKKIALTEELAWAHRRDQENLSETIKSRIKDLTDCIVECEKIVNDRQKKIEQHNEDVQILRTKIESIQESVDETRKKMSDIRSKETNCEGQQMALNSRISNYKAKVNRIKSDQHSLEKTISELKEQFRNQNTLDQDNEQRKLEIEKLDKEDIPRELAREKSIRGHTLQLNESMTSLRAELHMANEKVSRIKNSISSNHAILRRMKNGQDNQLRKYGDFVVKIRDEIDIAYNQKKFKHKPAGPLGVYLKLKSADIATSLEHLLGRNAHAFVCDNMDDMATLNSIFKKYSSHREFRQPAIIVRSFARRHEISRFKAVHHRYKTMLDYLEIDNDAVYNCLVDRCCLESVLFIPDYNEAQNLMIDQNAVPKHTRAAYTKDCSVMHPRTATSGYKAFSNNTRGLVLFSDGNLSQINDIERELTKQNAELREAEASVQKIQTSMDTQRREYDLNNSELRSILAEIRKKEERLLSLKTTIAKEPQELSSLEEEVELCTVNIAEEENKIRKETENLKLIESELADIRKEKDSCQKLMNTYDAEKRSVQKKIEDSRECIRKAKDDMAAQKIIIANKEKDKKEQDDNLNRIQENVIQSTQSFQNLTRPNRIRETDIIRQELKETELALKYTLEDGQDPEVLTTNLKKRIAEIEVINKLKDANLDNFNLSVKTLDQRKAGFKRLRDNTIHGVSATFSTVMRSMKMNGELRINIDPIVENGHEIKKGRTLEMHIDTNYEPSTQRPTGSIMSDNALNTRMSRSQPSALIEPPRPKRSRRNENSNNNDRDSGISEKENGDKMTDTRSLSGGERSFSTVAFVLALWHHCRSPFKLMDEIDVFMDMVTRRMSYTALIRFAQIEEEPGQFIFFSPLELPTFDDTGTFVRVFEMPIIVRKRPFQDSPTTSAIQ